VARSIGEGLNARFTSGDPFPHLVIDSFLPPGLIDQVLQNFPEQRRPGESLFELGHVGHHKRQIPPQSCNGFTRDLFAFFNSAPVLQYLETLSGIKGLLPDPYFMGGGFHEIARGGFLGIHADFRLHKQLRLHRRLNMLIYLNPVWHDDWGGKLELWARDKSRCVASVSPVLNRCVIFSTDADSYHGHPHQLACPPSVTRRSIALYYYTASESVFTEVPNDPTIYAEVARDGDAISHSSWSLRADRLMGEWAPPVVQRAVFRVKARLRARRR
jgi:hypothetical protein